jgi:methionyl-tRNA synthetase
MNSDNNHTTLIFAALPYANGDLHLGHLVEYVQADIFVRYQRLMERNTVFLCADDCHGTPIQLKARDLNRSPEELITLYGDRHREDFKSFRISFDTYHLTHSIECKKYVLEVFERLVDAGDVELADVDQFYCEKDEIFLPDRYLRGRCPACAADDQYGDVCENCQTHYESHELRNVRCALCGSEPARRTSKHYFFRLDKFESFLDGWVSEKGRLQDETRNWSKQWLESGLRKWDISRDGPYFGFKVPGSDNQFFYVWLDAPIGYLGATERYCNLTGQKLSHYWTDPRVNIYHFIGKDITYFHVLFWPAILHSAGYQTPTKIFVHGFLTVNGKKMSKSRGTHLLARTYHKYLDPEYLRFYYASRLTGHADDIDLDLDEFADRVNGELLHQIVNLPSRLNSLYGRLPGRHVGRMGMKERELYEGMIKEFDKIPAHYESREFARVVRATLAIASDANKYLSESKPWKTVERDPESCRTVCCVGIHSVRLVFTALQPVLPQTAERMAQFLNSDTKNWRDARCELPELHELGDFARLLEPVDERSVQAMLEESCRPHSLD